MKKSVSLVLALLMCLFLCACGGKQEQTTSKTEGNYTIDDLIGVWHSEDTQQILRVNPDRTDRYNFGPDGSASPNPDYQVEIDGNMISYSRLGKFQLEKADEGMKLVCVETGKVGKGTEFVKVENVMADDELNGDWYSSATGNSLQIIEGEIHPNHTDNTIYRQWAIAGDTLYVYKFGMFKIQADGNNIKLIDEDEAFVRVSSDELPTDNRIDFSEPILLFENETVRLEASAFYQEMRKEWDTPAEYKEFITLKFHNKADYEMMFFPDQFYIGDEKVKWGYVEGTPDILPGKAANYSFRIQKETDEPLDTLEDLYQLEGRFEMFRYENNRLSDKDYLSFSIAESYSAEK